MSQKSGPKINRSNDEKRQIILEYFYDRNSNATSARGAKGVAAKISDVRKDLKARANLSQQEVWQNLTYLISQGWVEEEVVEKQVPLKTGTVVPQSTSFYKITALGIDKIEGPSEFTVDKFKGIKIDATGQNIITIGDGNQIDARFEDLGSALAELANLLRESDSIQEAEKISAIADIETIQSQLAKAEPNKSVVRVVWEAVEKVSTAAGLSANVAAIATLMSGLL